LFSPLPSDTTEPEAGFKHPLPAAPGNIIFSTKRKDVEVLLSDGKELLSLPRNSKATVKQKVSESLQ